MSALSGLGRTIYDDGIARAADLGEGKYQFECSGSTIAFEVFEIAESAQALIKKVGGKLSILEAARATLEDIERTLPEEAAE